MHSIRARPICRANNTFSPSTALWQQFIAPNQHLPQRQRNSLFTTEATRSHGGEHFGSNGKVSATESHAAPRKKNVINKVRTSKGNFEPNRNFNAKKRQSTHVLLTQAHEAYDSAQDYEGVTVLPIETRVPVKENNLPWVPSDWERIGSAERLALEVQAFHEYVRPNQAESIARKHVVEQVRQHVRSILPNYILEVFGSERSGVAFANSDIDLRLVPNDVMSDVAQAKLPPNPKERDRRMKDLRKLHNRLINLYKKDYLLPTLRWARYPLISLQDKASGLDIQVVLSNDTSTSREFMKRYIDEYAYLPQLYSVLKATLDVRGLTDVFRGGVGSYSLFMMIVASLKHKQHPCNDAGDALAHFLRFWSTIKAEDHGISIEPPELFAKSEQLVMHNKAVGHIQEGKVQPLPSWMLTLRDPADETNDLGRKTIAWKHISKTLKSLAERLRLDMRENTRPSLLAWHVGPIYTLHQGQRRKLAEYGRRVATGGKELLAVSDVPKSFWRPELSSKAEEEKAAESATRTGPDRGRLAAIARAIREGETAASVVTESGGRKGEEDEGNPWLKDVVGESDHKQTGEALVDLLGLDKKQKVDKQEE